MRLACVAGQFYHADPISLEKGVTQLLENVKLSQTNQTNQTNQENQTSQMFGVVCPHAGHVYSGKTAAKAIDSIKEAETYIILCPNHTGFGKAVAVSSDSWQTPLGTIESDQTLLHYFENTIITLDEKAHSKEHSIEVILPFLQQKMKDKPFKILAICIGDHRSKTAKEIARVLIQLIRKENTNPKKLRVGIIASSDFSHYVPREYAKKIDSYVIEKIKTLNVDDFYDFIEINDVSVCGFSPIAVLMEISKEIGLNAEFLEYTTSGDVLNDGRPVVGYAAIGFRE